MYPLRAIFPLMMFVIVYKHQKGEAFALPQRITIDGIVG